MKKFKHPGGGPVAKGPGGGSEAAFAPANAALPASVIATREATVSEDGVEVTIRLEELSDGTIRVELEEAPGGSAGDLRGFFFDFAGDAPEGLEAVGTEVSDQAYGSVSNLGGGANVRGVGSFDAGVEFGSPGMSRDDISETSFVLSADTPLTLADFDGASFAVRLTSVGPEGGGRNGSLKLAGAFDGEDPGGDPGNDPGGDPGDDPDGDPDGDAPSGVDACAPFVISLDGVEVEIGLTDLGGGSVQVDVAVLETAARIGDLRALFFNLGDNDALGTLAVTGDDVTDVAQGNVSNLGQGANVNGLGQKFDVGVEFGTPGMTPDDIRATSFVITDSAGALALQDFANQDFAARLTSVGEENGARADSLKIPGRSDDLECASCEPDFARIDFEGFTGAVVTNQFPDVEISATDAFGAPADAVTAAGPAGQGDVLTPSASGGSLLFDFSRGGGGFGELDEIAVIGATSGGTITLTRGFPFDDALTFAIAPSSGTQIIDFTVFDSLIGTELGTVTGVTSMEIDFVGAGAVDDLCWEPRGSSIQQPASISGELWCDEQDAAGLYDGIDNETDPNGVAGRTVNLFDVGADGAVGGGDDSLVDTATTAQDGTYSFSDLGVGDYYVEFEAQGFTLQDQGPDEALDSDVDPASGRTGVISIAEGQSVADVDAGLECFKTNETGLLGIFNAIDPSGDQGYVLLNNNPSYPGNGFVYDSVADVLTVSGGFGTQVGLSAPMSGTARFSIETGVDENGSLSDPLGDSDMFIWDDADIDGVRDAGEEVYLIADVQMFGSFGASSAGSFAVDFALLTTGGTLQSDFPDLVGIKVNAESNEIGGYETDFDSLNAKGIVFGNLAYDCIC